MQGITRVVNQLEQLDDVFAQSLLAAPLGGRLTPSVHASIENVVLSFVNVTDQRLYGQVAKELMRRCSDFGIRVNCVDTTLAFIKSETDLPFLFVAGISDRQGHFMEDIGPKRSAQRFAASYNTALVLGLLLELWMADH